MEREQELEERLKQTERLYEQERRRWQHEKEEYQNLCAWYANSLRYQLGGLLINTLKHPLQYPLLPFKMYDLVKKHKQQQIEVRDIESSVPISVASTNVSTNFDFKEIEQAVNEVRQRGITIIIPIFNAYEDVKKCVDSIIKNMEPWCNVLLINDCSTDSRIESLLLKYSSYANIKVINNIQNVGYVKSINIGIQACETDVVLLNSDTIVTNRWLEKLTIAAYSDENIMTVTPLSNAAGVFSVPKENVNNELLEGWHLEDIAKIVENQSVHDFERVPTGNGFCMYVKRAAFEQVGFFDEDSFGKGYCEENDFCMRLLSKGYENIICDDTYIFHHHTASFQQEKQELLKKNKETLLARYPQYDYLVGNMLKSTKLARIRQNIQQGIKQYEQDGTGKKNVLYVIQYANGGSVKTNEDLMGYVEAQNWNVFMLNSDCNTLRLYQFVEGTLQLLQKWEPSNSWDIKTFYDSEWKNIYFNVLYNYHIDIVHIRHLYKHTFDIMDVADWMHIPTVLSFHDFYYICPTTNLINGKGKYCDARCVSRNEHCRISEPSIKIAGNLPEWVENNWRKQVCDVLAKADAFVTTSNYSKELYERIFPFLKGRVKIYEHGRDFAYPREAYGSAPNENEKTRILLAGNIDYNKGAQYISQLLDVDEKGLLEFHCIGNIPEELKDKVKYYGKYLRDDFKDYVVKIRPSFVGVFSIWPETYCHIITEAFSCGVPCVVSDIGTLRERGLKGGCILADLNNPASAYQQICSVSTNQAVYAKLADEALKQSIRTVSEMGKDYLNLYDSLVTRSKND